MSSDYTEFLRRELQLRSVSPWQERAIEEFIRTQYGEEYVKTTQYDPNEETEEEYEQLPLFTPASGDQTLGEWSRQAEKDYLDSLGHAPTGWDGKPVTGRLSERHPSEQEVPSSPVWTDTAPTGEAVGFVYSDEENEEEYEQLQLFPSTRGDLTVEEYRARLRQQYLHDLGHAPTGWDGKPVTEDNTFVIQWNNEQGVFHLDVEDDPVFATTPSDNNTILDTAKVLTSQDRQKEYGHPRDDFARIAAYWSTLFGVEVKPEQVPEAMILVKISRLHTTPGHHDSLVDIAGYARTYEMLAED